MAIKTPDILPGEPGYISKKEKNKLKKKEKKENKKESPALEKIKIKKKGYRIKKFSLTPKGEKFFAFRYGKKIGEIIVSREGKISLSFRRFGPIGNYKFLIRDVSFQNKWEKREKDLFLKQKECYLCGKKLSKNYKLYHYNMWKVSIKALEEAEEVPGKVAEGKLSLDEGWEEFNRILENANNYYMSLKETTLICPTCAKKKNLPY